MWIEQKHQTKCRQRYNNEKNCIDLLFIIKNIYYEFNGGLDFSYYISKEVCIQQSQEQQKINQIKFRESKKQTPSIKPTRCVSDPSLLLVISI